MEEKINIKKIAIFASIICAVLLAVTFVIPSVADSLKNTNTSEDVGVTATKTATWIDDDFTKGNVQITAKATGKTEYTPNVLFIGTLCSAHGLTKETVANSLNSIKATCNVDYWLCNNADPERTDNDKSGSIVKGGPNITQSDLPDMPTSNHQALQKFFKHIYEMTNSKKTETEKPYDFVVLEFDGTRISDWYRSLRPDDDSDPRNPSGDYTKYQYEDEAVNLLKTYYKNNQVIWITDKNVTESDPSSGYHPSNEMNVRSQNVHTRTINYNSLKGLVAPELYVSTTEHAGMTEKEYREIESKLSTDPVAEKYILGFDRQIGYSQSWKVGDFLKEAIESIFQYQIVINDKINLSKNLKITNDSVVFEMRDSDSDNWVVVPVEMKPQVNVNYETGEVVASVDKIEGDKQFRVTIGFEDKSATERFIDVSVDGNPNDGNAEVEVVPGTGVTPEPATPGTETPLDWTIPIYYVVEDEYKTSTEVKVSNPEDTITTNSTSKPEGSTAEESSTIKFQYWSTIIDGKDTFVSNDFKFIPTPDQTTNRFKTATYIAHFAKSPEETKKLTVSKVWSDGDDFHIDENITVYLYAGDKQLETISFGSSDKWTYTTKYDYAIYGSDKTTPIKYSFVEEVPSGYEATYEVEQSDPKTSGNTVITNTLTPSPEPSPTPSPDPGNVTPVGHGSVKTGDIVNVISLLIVAVIGSGSIIVINRIRHKKERG